MEGRVIETRRSHADQLRFWVIQIALRYEPPMNERERETMFVTQKGTAMRYSILAILVTAFCAMLLMAHGTASLTHANGTDLTISASVSGQACSADDSKATVNIKILVTSTGSAAPAILMVSNDGGATFTPIGTISEWSHSGRDKSAELAFTAVLTANTPTKFEFCAAQPGSNGNPDKRSCADLTIDPTCASYIPSTTLDYTASGADFLVIGAWGNDMDLSDMTSVASEMNTWASNNNSKFVISLGPNFFSGGTFNYYGVQSADDPKFATLWKNVYSGAALSQLPWWLVMGEQDWYAVGSPGYEMEHQDPNWNIPDYFHVQRFALPDSKHATLIYIEDDLLFYGYPGKKNMAANFQAAGWSAQENTHLKQLAWIDKALETANQDDYVLVIADKPVFTCGSDVTGSAYMTELGALIKKWKPTAYMDGHHHTLAYFLNDSTLHVQSGAGGNVDAPCAPLDPQATGAELANTYGFAHAQLTGSEFKIEFVTEAGVSWMQTSASARTPVVGVQADTTYLPPVGDPSIHKQ
jgi:hypothetical protein